MSGRGRPGREPTAAERKKVKDYIGKRASQRVIAAALERSIPNLRKYFAAELGLEKKSGPADAPITITAQQQADVTLMAACKEPRARIAKAIGVTEDQLVKYFAEELERGGARYRLKTLQRLDRMANVGSLSAIGKLAALTAPEAEAQDTSDAPAAAAAAGYVGKKATAKAEAAQAVAAGGKFAPRTPRLASVDGRKV